MPYGFARSNNGARVSNFARTLLRLNPEARAAAAGKPFDVLELAIDLDAAAAKRLTGIFEYFLGRQPDTIALSTSGRCATLPGYLRRAISVARPPESRRRPGWMLRLAVWPLYASVRLADSVNMRPDPVASVRAPTPVPKPVQTGAPVASDQPGINLVGYIAAELGLGEAARSLARACCAAGVPYSVIDVGYQSSNLQRDTQALAHASAERFAIDMLYMNADQTAATSTYLQEHALGNDYRIGFWHWKQPDLPPAHVDAFKLLDEVWVPSKYAYPRILCATPSRPWRRCRCSWCPTPSPGYLGKPVVATGWSANMDFMTPDNSMR